MKSLEKDIDKIIRNLIDVFDEQSNRKLVEILKGAEPELEQVGYDNFDGGRYFYTLHLHLPPKIYAGIGDHEKIKLIERELIEKIQFHIRGYLNQHLQDVIISPAVKTEASGRTVKPEIKPDMKLAFWEENHFRLFMSHISDFKQEVSDIQRFLKNSGISAFVAHEDIEPTREWLIEIDNALSTMDAMCAFLTPGFKESNWTAQEVGIAIGRKKLVIPVRKGIDPFGFIGRYQGFEGLKATAAEIASAISNILISHEMTATKMADCLVQLIEIANSWESVRANMKILEKSPVLNTTLVRRLEKALISNEKVAEAFGVPAKIEYLKNKFK